MPLTEIGASNPFFATVGATSVQILRPKAVRKGVTFTNDSANIIYLSKRDPAVVGSGRRLNAAGGGIWEPDSEGQIWLGAWYAIATGAGSNLCIEEDW